jgi:hypothetical protein
MKGSMKRSQRMKGPMRRSQRMKKHLRNPKPRSVRYVVLRQR